MADSIYIQLSDPWRQAVTITPEIARQIVAMATPEKSSVVHPAAPADDEAAIDIAVEIYNKRANELEVAWCDMDCMQSVLGVIRRGGVPGLTTSGAFNALLEAHGQVVSERDAAIARAENLQCVFDDYAKYTCRAQKTIKGGFGKNCLEAALDAMDTARAAHAEAMECIKLFYGVAVSMSPRKYEEVKAIRLAEALLKHQNKDSSK